MKSTIIAYVSKTKSNILKKRFSSIGYQVVHVDSPEECLEVLKVFSPSIIFISHKIFNSENFTLLADIKRHTIKYKTALFYIGKNWKMIYNGYIDTELLMMVHDAIELDKDMAAAKQPKKL